MITTFAFSLALLGCTEPEDFDYNATIGANARTPSTDALSFAIVVDGQGNGRVVGSLLNKTTKPTRLVDVVVTDDRQPLRAAMPDGPVLLPPDKLVLLAPLGAISVQSTTPDDFIAGLYVDLRLEIEGGEPIEMKAMLEPQTGPYAEIEVTAPPDSDIVPDGE